MIRKRIGIEIGTATVKIAVCKGSSILSLASARIPEGLIRDGRVTAPAAMTAFLKTLLQENHIRGGQCALVLPAAITICQHMTLPIMGESELKLNLPFEFKEYVGSEGDAYDYDYIIEGIHDGVMSLYAAAARRDVVEEYRDLFRQAGLHLKIATPPEMAWLNLIARKEPLPDKLAILDIGHQSTQLSIFANGNYVMGKEIELAGRSFDEIIAGEAQVDLHTARTRKETGPAPTESIRQCCHALALEIRKTVNFYNYSGAAEDAPLVELYFCGGGSLLAPLREAIASTTGMTLHPIHSLLDLENCPKDSALICAIAAGAALQTE